MKDIPIDDLKILVDEIIQQRESKEKEKRRKVRIEFVKVAITPLIIAIVGTLGTLIIAGNNNRNAKLIADEQIKAATIRADMVEKGADSRSKAERDVARLNQIKSIFEKIVAEEQKENLDLPIIKLHISSLEIYGDLAIDFLVKIRDIFHKDNPVIAERADKSIFNILQASQPDFTNTEFIGKDDVPLNLRTRQLKGFNFSGSTFQNVNLYKAGFRRSTLKGVYFIDADLYGADFSEANLRGTVFAAGTNLRNTNFVGAYLRDVKFLHCRNLEDAVFSLHALLKADQAPFASIPADDYLKLLVPHIEELQLKNDEDADSLKALLTKTERDYGQLIKELKQLRKYRMTKAINENGRGEAEA